MQVNDRVTVKTDGGPRREGVILAVEVFNEGTMYLVSLEDYPAGVWFFKALLIKSKVGWSLPNPPGG
ncbi:protein DsrB, partial [Serratia nevei]|uniref:protein DsrB n=1 Tax=Serratia nevei TaxID=2703794 RepID=UPI003F823DD1